MFLYKFITCTQGKKFVYQKRIICCSLSHHVEEIIHLHSICSVKNRIIHSNIENDMHRYTTYRKKLLQRRILFNQFLPLDQLYQELQRKQLTKGGYNSLKKNFILLTKVKSHACHACFFPVNIQCTKGVLLV